MSYSTMALAGRSATISDAEEFCQMIDEGAISPYFQPIVDVFLGELLSYEILSRGRPPFWSPVAMFAKAEEWGLLWELEGACHKAALRRIAELPLGSKRTHFFLNVTPQVFADVRFLDNIESMCAEAPGIDPHLIVFEITEANGIDDYGQFQDLTNRCVDRGFHIALDDFGAGHSSLVTLVAISPHYLKLDRALVSGIDKDAYKQNLVKSIAMFASSVGSKLIAEGVETAEELEALLRLGVRYAQGYLFAHPQPEPLPLSEEIRDRARELTRRFHFPRMAHKSGILSMVMRPPTVECGSMTCRDLDSLFRHQPSVDHLIVQRDGNPVGLVTKHHFYTIAGGPFGFDLIKKRDIEEVAKSKPLIVKENVDITMLGHLAMEREHDDLYDPVIVEDAQGSLIGTVTMKQLLTEAVRLELEVATSANPLTGLPGNTMIDTWLQEALESVSFSVVYADLDCFKEYNDSYGFPQGDQMIRVAAETLRAALPQFPSEAHLGHVGGDDFVIVTPTVVQEGPIRAICDHFDSAKRRLFSATDLQRNHYCALNRQGEQTRVPLVTLSLAVVTSENAERPLHPAQLGQIAAALKKKVKLMNAESECSGYLIDRRRHV